jgi:hypothetical protein
MSYITIWTVGHYGPPGPPDVRGPQFQKHCPRSSLRYTFISHDTEVDHQFQRIYCTSLAYQPTAKQTRTVFNYLSGIVCGFPTSPSEEVGGFYGNGGKEKLKVSAIVAMVILSSQWADLLPLSLVLMY